MFLDKYEIPMKIEVAAVIIMGVLFAVLFVAFIWFER